MIDRDYTAENFMDDGQSYLIRVKVRFADQALSERPILAL